MSKAKISDAPQIRQLENKVWQEDVVSKYDTPCFILLAGALLLEMMIKLLG